MRRFCALAASYRHFCALRCDGSVHWLPAMGISVLSDATVLYTGSQLSAYLCSHMRRFCTLAASYRHFCALRCDGSVHWQPAIGISVLSDATVLYTGSQLSAYLCSRMRRFCTLAASYRHICALGCDGSVHWQPAIGISVLSDVTVLCTGSQLSEFLCSQMRRFCTLAASYRHICALRCDGSVHWQPAIGISVL